MAAENTRREAAEALAKSLPAELEGKTAALQRQALRLAQWLAEAGMTEPTGRV